MSDAKTQSASDPAGIMVDTAPSIYPQFYMAIGHGIASWQHVEAALCDVFAKVSTCRDPKVAAAIYYGPRDFSEKLKLTHYAARLSLAGSPLLGEWAPLRKSLSDAAERRNALAHFQTSLQLPLDRTATLVLRYVSQSGLLIGEAPKAEGKPLRILLQPNASNPNEQFKEHQKETKAPMTIQAVIKTAKLFGNLQARVKEFSGKIPPPQEPQK
jgi:hypothetical protein